MRKMEAPTHSVTYPRLQREMVKAKGGSDHKNGQVFEAESAVLESNWLWGEGEAGALAKAEALHVMGGMQEETSRLEGKIMSSVCPDVSKPLS